MEKKQHLPRVLIIGGGFGGIEVAKKLKNQPVEVLLLDRHNHHTFQPLLYQVATGSLEAPSVAFPLRKMFRRQNNLRFRIADVQQILHAEKLVITDIGEFNYDYLVIATGATTNFFGNEDIAYYSLPMKNLKEAVNIRSFLLQNIEEALLQPSKEEQIPYLNFVVVGGGPTGVELSGAIAEIRNHILAKDYPELNKEDMHVFLVEGQDKVLANLSSQASEKAELYLRELGVTLMLNKRVTGYDGETITFADSEPIAAKTVIWSAGVMGQFPHGIPEDLIQRGRRIRIEPTCLIPGMDNVFAIGDVAAMITEETPNGHPGVAPAAQQQGRFVASQIIKILQNQPLERFKYFDKGSMATIGRNKAVVDIGKLRFQGFFAWWVWMLVHLMSLIGFRNRLVTFINWMISYITFNGGVRLIINKFERKKRNTTETNG
jgi:NADH dehydrogenase